MYGVWHRRHLLWGLLVGLCCLLLPFLGGMAANEAAARGETTQPVGATVEF